MERPIKITSFNKGVDIEFKFQLNKGRDFTTIPFDSVTSFDSYPDEDVTKSYIKILFKDKKLDLNYEVVEIDGVDMTSHEQLRETFRNLLLT